MHLACRGHPNYYMWNFTRLLFAFSLPPGRLDRTSKEWSAYPEGFHKGKRCAFSRRSSHETDRPLTLHLATATSTHEVTHSMLFGDKRKSKYTILIEQKKVEEKRRQKVS